MNQDAIQARLAAFRRALADAGCQAGLVLTSDPHLSEYLPGYWQVREWLSGFTGSAGNLLVTQQAAALWADSRYWEQAQAQLAGTGIVLMRLGGGAPGMADWLAQQGEPGRLAVDGRTVSLSFWRRMEADLAAHGWALQVDFDGVDQAWRDRPALPAAPVVEHDLAWAAEARTGKLERVRAAMREHGADWHLLSTLDDIAWLFNLRGSDVDYNPVFLAHALISVQGQAHLFVDASRLAAGVAPALQQAGVTLHSYEAITAAIEGLEGEGLLLDPANVVVDLVRRVPDALPTIEAPNPSRLFKACKLPAQQAHIRQVMEQDGAALCEFFAWFERELAAGAALTELTVDEVLTAARARRPGYVSLSFPSIAGFNANGAMPHYRALPESYADIRGNGLLLIDSGAQYLGGTTDITRVIPIGQPSAAQKRDFTLVLKGMIGLSRARFPHGASGQALDVLARAPLWEHGLDYGHGTGHGVGYFLNVHEGPQSISWRAAVQVPLEAGMVTSNEPGLYRPGQWGIRIENLVLAVPAGETEFGDFLAFETLTLCPIDTRCMDISLLREDELRWLDGYHADVRQRLAPLLQGEALHWLEQRTEPLLAPQ
ncbi:aminopeptidase P family protein [Kerstersia gyiorum]|uniref:aminopeptidase P family protein n=1 Tax=Kerstersia gyiorum TaxID=206506 RepID=UPI00209D04F3|nr:aminopeptidase P family protein [Kerstersia gyiorum]MCP1638226.1 Xaa-Pro aminopeptidase [Kerstersia gyiorum]MCP1671772.1 Xaa-Pro aminopeptidase [Kerstersia gyiorum]MCP1709583.1 Xaa-Pro aminopeptidase [Kerstersia gyiorum]